MKPETTTTIISFAAHLEDPAVDAAWKARRRNWIDEAGTPTPDGLALAAALAGQVGTRSSLRNFC